MSAVASSWRRRDVGAHALDQLANGAACLRAPAATATSTPAAASAARVRADVAAKAAQK